MRKLKHIKRFNESNDEFEYNSPEYIRDRYDDILDIYNKYGLDHMTPSEIDFLKSGGKIGANFRYSLPDYVIEGVDNCLNYLKSKGIKYEIEEIWAPSLGMIRYYQTKENAQKIGKEVFDKLKSMFPNTDKNTVLKFVEKVLPIRYDGPPHENIKKIAITIFDPEDIKDIVMTGPFNKGDELKLD